MKKLHYSVVYLVLISLIISGSILFSKPQAKYTKSSFDDDSIGSNLKTVSGGITSADSNEKSSIDMNSVDKNSIGKSSTGTQSTDKQSTDKQSTDKQLKQEPLKVLNNSGNIDMHATLTSDKYGLVKLKLAYKLNGKNVSENIGANQIKELRSIFRQKTKIDKGFAIKNLVLNDKLKKLYFYVEGKEENNLFRTTLFSYNLKSCKLEKMYLAVGLFNKFFLNSEGQYIACSYLSCPQNLKNNLKNNVIIFNCIDDKLIFDSNMKTKSKLYGGRDFYVFSYAFEGWLNRDHFKLEQEIRSKDGVEIASKKTLVYNLASK